MGVMVVLFGIFAQALAWSQGIQEQRTGLASECPRSNRRRSRREWRYRLSAADQSGVGDVHGTPSFRSTGRPVAFLAALGRLLLLRIGDSERYEVPDALIHGS